MDPLKKKNPLYNGNFQTSTDRERYRMKPQVAATGVSMMPSLFSSLPHTWVGGCVGTILSGRTHPGGPPGHQLEKRKLWGCLDPPWRGRGEQRVDTGRSRMATAPDISKWVIAKVTFTDIFKITWFKLLGKRGLVSKRLCPVLICWANIISFILAT